jgi:propionate CoA-transferase
MVGTFTAGGLDVRSGWAPAHSRRRRTRKFVRAVEHRTFSGREACKRQQRVLYVTERCVFQLVPDGEQGSLELIEIAPGIDLERDVLAHMDFMPTISPNCA